MKSAMKKFGAVGFKVWDRTLGVLYPIFGIVQVFIGLFGVIYGPKSEDRWTGFLTLSLGLFALGIVLLLQFLKKVSRTKIKLSEDEMKYDLKVALLRTKVNEGHIVFTNLTSPILDEVHEFFEKSSIEEVKEALKEAEMSDRDLARVVHERLEFKRVISE